MDAWASEIAMVDTPKAETASAVFPLLKLPRELRDQVYNHVLAIPETRGDRALRIERRHVKYFHPTAATVLLLLRHEYFLLNRQVANEALQVLLKSHTVFLSCGPFVLKTLLSRIEHDEFGQGKQWLKWLKKIELEWVTFPNLRIYPPNRDNGKDEWWWEQDDVGVDVDYVRGAQYSGHYDEHDYEGSHYDDNFYEPSDASLYPSFGQPSSSQTPNPNDPFNFSNHYPFSDPHREPTYDTTTQEDIATKLDLLVAMEVTPLFDYLSTPTFTLSSITLPLYFISKQAYHNRNTTRPGYALPLKIRYWVHVVVHALLMLQAEPPKLDEVRIKYMPWDIWASMDPSDDLYRIAEQGVWFRETEDEDGAREGEGEAFKAVWNELMMRGIDVEKGNLVAEVRLLKWEGDLDKYRVGDELEVVFTLAKDGEKKTI